MVQLVALTPERVGELLDDLLWDDDRPEERVKWETVFRYRWQTSEFPTGYVLLDEGRIVGYQGTIWSERVIGGQTHRLCNVHSWVVQEAYRGQSLALMRPVLRRRDHTLTDMAPSRSVHKLLMRFGFAPLDSSLILLFPCGQRGDAARGDLQVVTDMEMLRRRLPDRQWQLVDDHRGTQCQFVEFFRGDDSCLLGYTVARDAWPAYCCLQYCSSWLTFERYQGQIRDWLMRQSHCRLVGLDSRHAGQIQLRRQCTFPTKTRKLFRANNLPGQQVDNLYTDLAITGVSGLPSWSNAVRRQLGRFLPGAFDRGRNRQANQTLAT